jgi:chemotaxis regulatin CheY-phosphate phosphatase CheZ
LQESSRKMPKASNQLNKVTEATEMATTEILDMVDAISFKLNGIQTNINRFKSYGDLQDDLSRKVKRRLAILEQKYPDDEDVKSAMNLWEKVDQSANLMDPLNNTQTHINEMRQIASNIMIALQVQDITSQQIASVNHLIESVQQKLNNLLESLASEDRKNISVPEVQKVTRRVIAFDPEAEYTVSGARQHIADEILNEQQTESGKPEEKLEENPVTPSPALNEAASQDDIDALFR